MDKQEIKVNKKGINELIASSNKLLKLLFVIVIFIGIYAIIQICNALGIPGIICSILKILLPLFIGLAIAWLFNPLVRKLEEKGVKRGLGSALIYLIFIGIMALILFTLIPLLYQQIMDLVNQIPSIGSSAQNWINSIFDKFSSVPGLDVDGAKLTVLDKLNDIGHSLSESLPSYVVTVATSVFSGLGTFLVGLVIGFYALLGFDHPTEAIEDFLPKKMHKNFEGIAKSVNTSCRNFVNGALIDSTLVFFVSTIGLWIVGLKSPVLFGLFCGITNVIPYAGPYIGGIPAVIVGFSQGPVIGLLTLLVICIIQAIEGNFFQPIIMSKTTKLHPVTIILGLLLFGHFWGIIGMLISTPVIACCKSVFIFLDDKYNILDFKNDDKD